MDKLFKDNTRNHFPDTIGMPFKIGWFFLSWTGFNENPRNRDFGYHKVRDHYLSRWGALLKKYGDEHCWHYHHPSKSKVGWEKISLDTGVGIKTGGLESIPNFSFSDNNSLELMTYFNQEMLKRGFLTTGMTAATVPYTNQIIENYLEASEEVFRDIATKGMNVINYLKGGIKHSTFTRLVD